MEVKTDSRVSCTHDFYNTAVAPVTKLEPVTEITLASDDAEVKHVEPPKKDDDATPGKPAPCNAQPTQPEEGQRPSVSTVDTKSNVGKYRLLRTIGKGNFAKVKLAIHMATGVEVRAGNSTLILTGCYQNYKQDCYGQYFVETCKYFAPK